MGVQQGEEVASRFFRKYKKSFLEIQEIPKKHYIPKSQPEGSSTSANNDWVQRLTEQSY